ncbi:hypothetical protein [Streptomyces violascens]|uniref:hypothetical protein n=1 Tax=Streptomyces violascens TaxID=67381 RepID=UPI0016790919|nr:hypothetical protein [Streptomyces violascens]GGU39119.1 hypothetical protein GCM10010289_70010 [Streptomyces violascens]
MTQTSYNVRVEYDVSETPPDEIITALYEDLAPYGGSIGSSPAGGLTVRLFLDADSPVDAGTRGVEYVQGALLKQGLDITLMSGYEVITEAEFERRLDEPHVPELAGMAEVTRITGASKGRASQLRPELKQWLVQELASGPVYLAEGVRRFAARNHNRVRGVRRTEIPLTPLERALLESLAAAELRTEVSSPTPDHQAVGAAIEGVVGNGRQLQLHTSPADSDLTVALGTLIEHGLASTRKLYKKELHELDAGHEEDLVVTLTGKGHRHADIDATTAAAESAGAQDVGAQEGS